MITFYFECGCVLTEDKIYRRAHRVICPKHQEALVIRRTFPCLDCGTPVEQSLHSRIKHRCPEHTRLHKNKLYMDWYNKQKTDVSKFAVKAPERRRDCKFYDECLTPKVGKLMKNSKACTYCKKYKKSCLDIMDYAIDRSYSDFAWSEA